MFCILGEFTLRKSSLNKQNLNRKGTTHHFLLPIINLFIYNIKNIANILKKYQSRRQISLIKLPQALSVKPLLLGRLKILLLLAAALLELLSIFCIQKFLFNLHALSVSNSPLALERKYRPALNSFYAFFFYSQLRPNFFQQRSQAMRRIYQSLLAPQNLRKYSCLPSKQRMEISKLKDQPYGISTVFQRQELMQIQSPHTHQLCELLASHTAGSPTTVINPTKLQSAQAIITKMQQTSQSSQKLHILLAKSFLMQENYEAAIREYNKAWKLSPNSSEYCINIAVCLMAGQNYYDAIKILQNGARRHQETPTIYHHLAIVNLKIENYRQTILNFYKSYRLNPKIDEGFIKQGKELLCQEKYSEALPFFIKWAIHRNDQQQVLNGLIKCFINSQKLEEAKQFYACLGEIEQYKIAADHSLALLHFQSGNLKQAKGYLCSAIKSKSDNFQLNLYLGTVYISEDRPGQAVACLQKCLKAHHQDPNVLNSLGLIYLKLSSPDKALHFYQESVKANESDSMSWYGLGISFLQKNDVQKGISHLKKAIELDGNNYPALEKLGNTLYLLGDEKQGNILLQRAQKAKEDLSRY